jgi:pre-mRNA-splicing factor CWC26
MSSAGKSQSSNSKLAYLSKYLVDNNNDNVDEDRNKKDKKKHKKKHKKHKSTRADRITCVDVDDGDGDNNMTFSGKSRDDKDRDRDKDNESEEDDDDGPVVVAADTTTSDALPVTSDRASELAETKERAPGRRRRRYDSDSDASDAKDDKMKEEQEANQRPPRRRPRYDSEDDDEKGERPVRQGRQRHDSPEPETTHSTHRRRHDSSASSSDEADNKDTKTNKKQKMSSGHAAGLQTGGTFQTSERSIQDQRRKESAAMVDKYGMGETVYRDESGKKTDNPPSKQRNQSQKQKHPPLTEQQQQSLNTGRVQKEAVLQQREQYKEVQESSFARHADDAGLDEHSKHVIRAGDPMAAQATKKQSKTTTTKSGNTLAAQRPTYKGPPPKPNRFGTRPGFRWDGVDRGNGFEDKILAKRFNAEHQKEQAYRWSTADM